MTAAPRDVSLPASPLSGDPIDPADRKLWFPSRCGFAVDSYLILGSARSRVNVAKVIRRDSPTESAHRDRWLEDGHGGEPRCGAGGGASPEDANSVNERAAQLLRPGLGSSGTGAHLRACRDPAAAVMACVVMRRARHRPDDPSHRATAPWLPPTGLRAAPRSSRSRAWACERAPRGSGASHADVPGWSRSSHR